MSENEVATPTFYIILHIRSIPKYRPANGESVRSTLQSVRVGRPEASHWGAGGGGGGGGGGVKMR